MTGLDPRLNAFRPDLADMQLEGRIKADRFVTGVAASVSVPVAPVRKKPDHSSGLDTEALFGDPVNVFEREHGWAWIQSEVDGYVGYVDETDISTAPIKPTHIVSVPRTFVYPHAELKSPHMMTLSIGSGLVVTGFDETRGTRYATLETGGHVVARHIRPIDDHCEDFVAVAETLVGTPYLWGGTSSFGIDCSGLVQLAMRMTGRTVLRDTDMQQVSIGEEIDPGVGIERGDLVFWRGHVAIMRDGSNIIHASGHTMLTSFESLTEAIERIGYLYGDPIAYRRP